MAKKNVYNEVELDWAEKQLGEWKDYIDANPLATLKDRIEWKPTARGGTMPMVIASMEAQGKFIQETLKNYLLLLSEVSKMREIKEKEVAIRGGSEIEGGGMMKNFIKGGQ